MSKLKKKKKAIIRWANHPADIRKRHSSSKVRKIIATHTHSALLVLYLFMCREMFPCSWIFRLIIRDTMGQVRQPKQRSCFSGWARDGSSGVGATDVSVLQSVQNDSGAHPPSYSMETGFLSLAWSGQSVKPTTHLHPQPSFRMSESIPVFFICAVMIWTRQSLLLIKWTWYKKSAYYDTLSILVRVTKSAHKKTILCRSMSVVDDSWRRSRSKICVFHISLQISFKIFLFSYITKELLRAAHKVI